MAVKVIYNMQCSALKSKQWMCTEFTADSRAFFFLMKNISCLSLHMVECHRFESITGPKKRYISGTQLTIYGSEGVL